MATKKKSKKAPGKKVKSKKSAKKKAAVGKRVAPAKKLSKKAPPKKTKKRAKPVASRAKRREEIFGVDSVGVTPAGIGPRSGGQSGSLQGLSNSAGANSESVDELIEEGNSYEAEAVKGVEDALDPDEGEVHTHEVPEDDVPGEYDDQ